MGFDNDGKRYLRVGRRDFFQFHLESPVGTKVVLKRHRLALLQRQIADCDFVGVQLSISNAGVFNRELLAIALDELKCVKVIAVEIECADDALCKLVQRRFR